MGKHIPILLGIGENGRSLTCSECVIYSSSASYSAPHSVSWHELHVSVHRCFIGAHITQENNVRVQQFSSFFTGFNQWASAYGHELFSQEQDDEQTSIKRSDAIDGFGQLKIWRAGGGNATVGEIGKRIEIRYWRPSFEPSEPVSIDKMLDTIRDFQRLLCLLQARPVGFNDLRAEMAATDAESEVKDLEIMVRMTGYKESFDRRQHFETLVPLREIDECWSQVLSKWFTSQTTLAAPLNLYFAAIFAADLFDEQKILFLAQALEGYHRCKFKNQRSFLERLSELANAVSSILSHFINDQPTFLETVRDTRDELTHPGLSKVDLARINTHAMWRQLKAMFEICVLRDLGIAPEVVTRIARECKEWVA